MQSLQNVLSSVLVTDASDGSWLEEQVDARIERREQVNEAMKAKNWPLMAIALRDCLELEPEWVKGHFNLRQAFINASDYSAALSALWAGLRIAPQVRELSTMLSNLSELASVGADFTAIGCDVQDYAQKLSEEHPKGCWDPCVALDVATQDVMGSTQILYKRTMTGEFLFDTSRPLRLIFLDVDGVLNTVGSADSGKLCPVLLSRMREVVLRTGASVVLSSTWRHWAQLRALIIAALPKGCVVGQTPLEDPQVWRNDVRPREIRDFLNQIEAEVGQGVAWAAVDDMDLVSQGNRLARTDKSMRAFAGAFSSHFAKTEKDVGFDDEHAARLAQLLTIESL
jgi:hypothetical protein